MRTKPFVRVRNLLYTYKTILYAYKSVLYAYKRFRMRTKGFVWVQKVLYAYKSDVYKNSFVRLQNLLEKAVFCLAEISHRSYLILI